MLEGLAADYHKDILIITQDQVGQQRLQIVPRRKTELNKGRQSEIREAGPICYRVGE